MTDQTAPQQPPAVRRYAKGVRGALPRPRRTAAELSAIRTELRAPERAMLTRREQVEWLRARGLTYDQCGQVLGVSENRIARILKPQRAADRTRAPGTVSVRCLACCWRGNRLIDTHGACPRCGADDEQVIPSSQVQWLQVPIPVDALAALGPDPTAKVCAVVAAMVARVTRRKRT